VADITTLQHQRRSNSPSRRWWPEASHIVDLWDRTTYRNLKTIIYLVDACRSHAAWRPIVYESSWRRVNFTDFCCENCSCTPLAQELSLGWHRAWMRRHNQKNTRSVQTAWLDLQLYLWLRQLAVTCHEKMITGFCRNSYNQGTLLCIQLSECFQAQPPSTSFIFMPAF